MLVVLAERADKKGENAWPSVPTIMSSGNLSETTVRRALSHLRAAGAIHETGKHKSGTTVYRLEMPLPNRQGAKSTPPSQIGTPPLPNRPSTPAKLAPEPSLTIKEPPLRAPRARDPIWDALIAAEGKEPVTKSERGRLNAAVKELRDAGVDAAAIPAAASAYQREWPGVTLTANALVANWSRFAVNGHSESGAERLRRAMAERGVA